MGSRPSDTQPTQETCSSLLGKVLGLKEIGHVLWLGVRVLVVVMVVRVRIVCGADVVHLVGGTALHAAGLGLFTGKSDPEDVVRVDGEAGATDVLLVTSGVDDDGVLWGACVSLALALLQPYM